ncbi:DUF4234 domain-containing protein [Streptomyces sp. NPDC005963]|uniref:DUF4234 domain-containing protein n=1 Tax=Streptomyces sp. NPDC005963 TaxID=3156721 RepID=UPI0033C214DB
MVDVQPNADSSQNTAPAAGVAVAPQGAEAPVAGRLTGLTMKRRGPAAVWIGLPLITLGVYQLVWYYKILNELQEFDRRRVLKPGGSVLVLIFLGWTLIAPLISFRNTARAIANAQRAAGLPVTCNPTTATLLFFAFGLSTWYMQSQLNLVNDAYPGTAPGTEVALVA